MSVQREAGTSHLSVFSAFKTNFLGIKQAASWSALLSGFIVVLISSTGPLAVLFQAAEAGHFSSEQTASWLLTIFIGSGLFGLILTLRHGMPVIGAWGSATTALLVTALPLHSFPDVVGAYFVASAALLLVGMTGIFSRLIALVPRPVVMAMLAGVLFQFGVNTFSSLQTNAALGISMILAFFVARRYKWRAPVVASLFVGLFVAALQSKLVNPHVGVSIAKPVWTTPTFSIGALFTVALPIFLLVLTTQNATGIAVLYNSGYEPPVNHIVSLGGVLSLVGAGFGGSGVNISAITAAIATQDHADPNPKTRYFAGISAGVFYLALGLLGATVTGLFTTLPPLLLAVLAGLALLPVIGSSIHEALADSDYRDAGLVTLLVTISGVSAWNLGAPFWGLMAGVAVHRIGNKG
jgi:benzoate membrane transport protein